MKALTEILNELDACQEAILWANTQPSKDAAWRDCQRGDWMLWLLATLSGPLESKSRRKVVLCVCECARLSLKYVPKGEKRPRRAIETAEKWARREEEITLDDVINAAYAAYAASAAAYAAYADAAYADADADAAAADAAAGDAAFAAYSAAYSAAAADSAASVAARPKMLAKCAEIVRKHYPRPPRYTK